MTDRERVRRAGLRRVTWASAAATAWFLGLSWLSTQVASIRESLPFTEDPYDGVVSFAVIGVVVVGGVTAVRALAHAGRAYDPAVARRIAIGWALCLAMAVVAVASDVVALVVVGADPGADGESLVIGLLVVSIALSLVGVAAVWLGRRSLLAPAGDGAPEPDLIDDLGSLAQRVGLGRLATWLIAWVERSRLSPRRHRILVGVAGGIAAGIAASAWHAFREGAWASPAAAVLFGSLWAAGVVGAYLIGLEPLRIVRPARAGGES